MSFTFGVAGCWACNVFVVPVVPFICEETRSDSCALRIEELLATPSWDCRAQHYFPPTHAPLSLAFEGGCRQCAGDSTTATLAHTRGTVAAWKKCFPRSCNWDPSRNRAIRKLAEPGSVVAANLYRREAGVGLSHSARCAVDSVRHDPRPRTADDRCFHARRHDRGHRAHGCDTRSYRPDHHARIVSSFAWLQPDCS